MKKRRLGLSLILLGLVGGLLFANAPKTLEVAKADDVTVIDAGYCSTYVNATKDSLHFNMQPNDAPYAESTWSIRYRPMSADCVTILRNGETHNIAGNTLWDMITKCDSTKYLLETWMMGEYKPQLGDIYTIKGDFICNDTAGSSVTGKYILRISETSFIVSGNDRRTFFTALPQKVADGGPASMPPEPDQQWHFLFNLNNLEQADAPVTGDSTAYYPTSTEDVYIDGQPVANVDRQVLRRRDNYGYMFYVCFQNDIQQWTNLIKLDSLIVFDGTFALRDRAYENNKHVGFSLKEVAFHKIGDNVNDYEVVNFRGYLIEKIRSSYILEYYSEEDQIEIEAILSGLEEQFIAPASVKEVYQVYNSIVATLDSYELDPEAAAKYLAELKAAAIEELQNYVDLDNYLPAQQQTIIGYINAAIETINAATQKQQISSCVLETKALINNVKTKRTVMVESVKNQTPGYEEFLAIYNRVSLNDLNIGPQTFHGRIAERRSDFNSNIMDTDITNTFVPLDGNDKGNVVFQFAYTSNALPVEGANMMVVLRGMPYYGYKFAIDTNTRGCFVEIISQEGGSWHAGISGAFVEGRESIVEVGAVDLIEFNLTWLFIRVDGVYYFNDIFDSLSICKNPRVAICPNDSSHDYNDYEGSVLVSNYSEGVKTEEGIYGGMLLKNKEASSSKELIACTLDKNAIPFNSVSGTSGYPLSESAVQLTRDDITTPIANPTKPLIKKISENDYQVLLSEIVEPQDGDTLTIKGQFAFFIDNVKSSFTIAESTFTYRASSNTWEQTIDLEVYKKDAILKLENFVNLAEYDEEEVETINRYIDAGKGAINRCSSVEEVDSTLSTYKQKISEVKTSFRKYKDNAIDIVNNYKADVINEYRKDEQDDIRDLKADAVLDIEQALTNEEIDAIVDRLIYNIDKLKTDQEYSIEELEDAKTEGIKKIQNHYGALNPGLLSASEREALNNDTLKAISDIKEAKTIAEVESIIENYQAKYPLPASEEPTKNNQTALVLWIVIPSSVALIGLAVLLVFIIRKRKKVQ